jgi:hypothetical protein
VNVALEFHEKSRGRDLLDRLTSQAGVDVNVVRGRLTENEARYELRLSGLRKRLQKAFRLCAGPGVDCRVLSLRSGS